MNTTIKAMQHLNNAEKKAVKAHRILTHAFFTSGGWTHVLLKHRYDRIDELPLERRALCLDIAAQIEEENWKRWCDEAVAAGLRQRYTRN